MVAGSTLLSSIGLSILGMYIGFLCSSPLLASFSPFTVGIGLSFVHLSSSYFFMLFDHQLQEQKQELDEVQNSIHVLNVALLLTPGYLLVMIGSSIFCSVLFLSECFADFLFGLLLSLFGSLFAAFPQRQVIPFAFLSLLPLSISISPFSSTTLGFSLGLILASSRSNIVRVYHTKRLKTGLFVSLCLFTASVILYGSCLLTLLLENAFSPSRGAFAIGFAMVLVLGASV
jgi:hypothetical protein